MVSPALAARARIAARVPPVGMQRKSHSFSPATRRDRSPARITPIAPYQIVGAAGTSATVNTSSGSSDLPGPLRPAVMDWSPSQADGSSVINVLGQNDFQTRTAASTSIVGVPGSAGIIGPPGLDNAMALVPSSPTLHDGIPSGIAGLPAPEATFAPDAAQALNFGQFNQQNNVLNSSNHLNVLQQQLNVALTSHDPQIIAEAWQAIDTARRETENIRMAAFFGSWWVELSA